MPTTYTDQFYLIDPYAPPPVGTALNFVNFNLTDQNNDGDFDRSNNDRIDGSDIRASYAGDTVTVNVPGVGNVTYTGTTFYLADGRQVFTPNDGQVLQNGTFVSSTWTPTQGPLLVSELGPACFVAGTLIRTAQGDVPVEDLQVGAMVETLDHGLQPVRWHGHSPTAADGDHAPVIFHPGAIGNTAELRVSPQHRMLVRGWRAELFFGCDEVLVPAKHLVDGKKVVQVPCEQVDYHHILFDRHEIIWSNGVPSESFFPGDQILLTNRGVRAELLEIFPELADDTHPAFRQTARTTVKSRECTVLRRVA